MLFWLLFFLEIDVVFVRFEVLEVIEKNGWEEYKIVDEIWFLVDLICNV